MMTSYYKRDFSSRWDAMGDESERMFEQTQQATETGVAPFGLNRPPIGLTQVPEFIRYMPDRLQHNRLVECMGIGRDGVLKLKLDKLYVLLQWDHIFPVDLFIWDSSEKRYTFQHIQEVHVQCERDAYLERFPEGRAAWFLNVVQILTWEWTDAP